MFVTQPASEAGYCFRFCPSVCVCVCVRVRVCVCVCPRRSKTEKNNDQKLKQLVSSYVLLLHFDDL